MLKCQKNSNPYFYTLASCLKSCEENVVVEKASIVYKHEVAAMNDDGPLGLPRNVQQLRNFCFRVRLLSHDALCNLHELGYDMPGFIWKIV